MHRFILSFALPQVRTANSPGCGCSFAKVATVAVLLSATLLAQQKSIRSKPAPPPTPSGIVSGRVFLITGGGDLKPARLAKVILLFSARTPDDTPAEPNTAGRTFAEAVLRNMQSQMKAESAERSRTRAVEDEERFEKRMCRTGLQVYSQAEVATIDWLETETDKGHQLVSADADEEGNFKMTAPPGSYILLAQGRAGFNDAAWWANVAVRSGEVTTVKMATPVKSCLDSAR